MNSGVVYAFAAYALWGVAPLYFRLLRSVPTFEVLMHRMVWSLVAVALVLAVLRRWRWIGGVASSPKVLKRYALAAVLIGINWYVYIWSVANGHVIDASLGYFITPLFIVLLGRVVLGERLRPMQWTSIALAAAGVVWLGVQAGHAPWIGLALAFSFGTYGLVKKTAPLGALEGMALETGLLFPFAVIALVVMGFAGQHTLIDGDVGLSALLIAAGPLTALPLLLFAAGARRIPLATLGLLQYVAPTLQLLNGVLVFGEPFGGPALVGYALIWTALILYAAEGLWRARRPVMPVVAPE